MGYIAEIVSAIGMLGVLTLAYNFGRLTQTLDQNTKVLTQVYNIVVDQDDRIQNLESNKADKIDVNAIDKRLTIIETEHKNCRKDLA